MLLYKAAAILAASFTRGNKFFELSNHLGNVLVTLSDKKKGILPCRVNK
jgi:hypothetical protein